MIQSVEPEQVRQITQKVLEKPEFQDRLDLWARLFRRVTDFFAGLAAWSVAHPGLSRLLVIALGVLLILLLAHIIYTLSREFLYLRRPPAANAGAYLRPLEGVADNWNDAFRLAREALEKGDVYRALWITHRILLSALDRLGVVKFTRWKTNTDYLRECGANGAPAETLSDVSAAYERVVYAHGSVSADDAQQLIARVEALANGGRR